MPGGRKHTKPITQETVASINRGLTHLVAAREYFKLAEANNTVIAINKAISSAKGAHRHANLIATLSRGSFNP